MDANLKRPHWRIHPPHPFHPERAGHFALVLSVSLEINGCGERGFKGSRGSYTSAYLATALPGQKNQVVQGIRFTLEGNAGLVSG